MEKEYEIARAMAMQKRVSIRIPVIGVTGSVGKTTMKEMLVAFLGGDTCVAHNEGSRNIAETMVLNVASIKPDHRLAVFEFGVDSTGQMEEMVAIARPTIPVLTGISESHFQSFQSLDAVYKEKRKILYTMPEGGKIIANGECENLMKYLSEDPLIMPGQVITYGFSKECTVYADEIRFHGLDGYSAVIHAERLGVEPFKVTTKLLGRQMLLSMIGAIMVALLFHVSVDFIKETASSMEYIPRRMQLIETGEYTIIDDAYNASVVSMEAALDQLQAFSVQGEQATKSRSVAILGDMLELGDLTVFSHEKIGAYAVSCADVVICIGTYAKHMFDAVCQNDNCAVESYYFETVESFLVSDEVRLNPGDLILVKASNQMRFETIVDELRG